MKRAIVHAGTTRAIDADENATLLDVLRGELGVRSASRGCDDGRCGTCRVLVDGRATNACIVRWGDVKDAAVVESYEDVASDDAAVHAVEAFHSERPTRCRLCIGSLGVTAVDLARRGKSGDADAIEETLSTATCMCTGRGSLRRALL